MQNKFQEKKKKKPLITFFLDLNSRKAQTVLYDFRKMNLYKQWHA